MRLAGFIWLEEFVDKLATKHAVQTEEVEQIFLHAPYMTKSERGHVRGEDLYRALGQTDAGRRLAVFFVLKHSGRALVISAREMQAAERREYERHKTR